MKRQLSTSAICAAILLIHSCTGRHRNIETSATVPSNNGTEDASTSYHKSELTWETNNSPAIALPSTDKPKKIPTESHRAKSWESSTGSGSVAEGRVAADAIASRPSSRRDLGSTSAEHAGVAKSNIVARPAAPASPVEHVARERAAKSTPTMDIQSNILTAGSFDDRDDLSLFARVWDQSPLASLQISTISKGRWHSLKKNPSQRSYRSVQIALVIDTTGSMGDELAYIQAELRAIVAKVNRTHPGVAKEFAVIVYRDSQDEYVTRGLNFTTSLTEVQTFIDRQDANGGGDYPEAVHIAMQESIDRLSWSTSAQTAKMIFHVADAPAHDAAMDETFIAFSKIAEQGIAIYPVAASGVMDAAEAMMRAAAVLSGGQYIFLTDDSGVGLAHQAPKHPCYNVEKLGDIMVRMINDKISGKRSAPQLSSIIRTVGSQDGQQCPIKQQYVRTW